MIVRRAAKETLTPVEMMHGDSLEFRLLDGRTVTIDLADTGAEITETSLEEPGVEEPGARTTYRFWADLVVDGSAVRLEREVGPQRSFYEPWGVAGVRIWLDAVDAVFDFMNETHGPCRLQRNCSHHLPPRRHARLALQDASTRICPGPVHPWSPLPPGGLRIEDCYRGEDCWMGAYDGASAHGGLDINHPRGTPLHAPIDLDDQFLYNSVDMGHNNNRWRGVRRWSDGSQCVLTSCHMTRLTVPERRPLERGRQYAEGAGVWVGAAEHSHFAFAVFDHGELFRLDPWILFWQMYRDLGADAPGRTV
ncbi:MAG: hypothetical protein ACYTKD_16540 [Planctomycetota bacterium]|jgi:hypothetical protein